MTQKPKPLWTCPDCGHQFVTRNLWHSCVNYPMEKHFERKSPEVIALHPHYLSFENFGPVTVNLSAKHDRAGVVRAEVTLR